MNFAAKLLPAFAFAGLMASSFASQAATIGFIPDSASVTTGGTIQIKLVGSDFSNGTFGGGLSVAWDASLLSLQSFDTSVFPGDLGLADVGVDTVIDNNAGKLENLSVASFFQGAPDASFDIAVLTFKGLASGTSLLQASLGQFSSGFDNIWTDYNNDVIGLQFAPASLNVAAVPLPGAAWLFGSVLLGGLSMACRQRA
ncbi:hypothetical protein A1507_19670 [Methylomonas koyamae]|uniref:Cohesin domain-containing protein n=1 Tax=Methylomonas koyamae TaxID=702114 RepID=A0A177N1H8_9GAMM|nr:hypothetical protein [Methylomonas koyamae]OAI11818.1 hypothetical protein A1507_19670 [Methylomonas koyamae]